MSDDRSDAPGESIGAGQSSALVNLQVNVKGFAKAAQHLAKVLDNIQKTISRGIGTVYSPIGRVREAEADEKIAVIRTRTLIDAEKSRFELEQLRLEHAGPDGKPGLEQRAVTYLIEDATRKQDNREKVADEFVSDLCHNMPAEDAKQEIEDGWLTQFWSYAENVDSADVRSFYARLLSSEVAKPGSISPLTLRTLSVLSREAAEKFQLLCHLSIDTGDEVFVIHPHVFAFQGIGPLEEYGISLDDLFELEAYDLIRSAETITLTYAKDDTAKPERVDYAGKPALLNLAGRQTRQLKFTRAGREIRRLLSLNPVPAYTAILREILSTGFAEEGDDLTG